MSDHADAGDSCLVLRYDEQTETAGGVCHSMMLRSNNAKMYADRTVRSVV